MTSVTLRLNETESTLSLAECTIERLLAEARSVGLDEFSVFCNGVEVLAPNDLKVKADDLIVITPPEDETISFEEEVHESS